MLRGFVKLKKIKKSEENLCVFSCLFCVVFMFQKKKIGKVVDVWGLADPSFCRIFGFFSA